LHVLVSLIGIFAGAEVLSAMIGGRLLGGWNAVFPVTTIATNATGSLFHSSFGPPHVIRVIFLAVLAIAVVALYGRQLAWFCRASYAAAAVLAPYLNVFVGVAQAFQKLPFLEILAPTQSEPPFLAAQSAVLVAFVIFGFLAVRWFRLA
jgi:hypothetical protein